MYSSHTHSFKYRCQSDWFAVQHEALVKDILNLSPFHLHLVYCYLIMVIVIVIVDTNYHLNYIFIPKIDYSIIGQHYM